MINITAPLTGTLPHVWTQDPALDMEKSDYTEFTKSGDLAKLVAQDSKEFTVFKIGRLSRQDFLRLADRMTDGLTHELFAEAVSLGLKGWKGEIKVGGEPLQFKLDHEGTPRERVSEKVMDVLTRIPALIDELGVRVIAVNKLDPL